MCTCTILVNAQAMTSTLPELDWPCSVMTPSGTLRLTSSTATLVLRSLTWFRHSCCFQAIWPSSSSPPRSCMTAIQDQPKPETLLDSQPTHQSSKQAVEGLYSLLFRAYLCLESDFRRFRMCPSNVSSLHMCKLNIDMTCSRLFCGCSYFPASCPTCLVLHLPSSMMMANASAEPQTGCMLFGRSG